MYKDYPLVIDASDYKKLNFAQLATDPYAPDAYIFKLGEVDDTRNPTGRYDTWLDDDFTINVQGAYTLDKPCGAYFFDDGGAYWLQTQKTMDQVSNLPIEQDVKVQTIIKQLRAGNGWKKVGALFIDVERWWWSYSEWLQYKRGTLPKEKVKLLPAAWITFSYQDLIDKLERLKLQGNFPDIEIIPYSARWFIDGYTKSNGFSSFENLVTVRKQKTWVAQYYFGSGSVQTTFKEIRERYLPPDTFKPNTFGNDPKGWTLWQFSGDRFTVPSIQGSLDLNFFKGTKEELHKLFKFTPKDTIPLPPPPPVSDLTLRVEALEAEVKTLKEQVAKIDGYLKGYN